MKYLRDFVIAASMLALAYVASYLTLSFCGRYEAPWHGAEGPKWYEWTPAGLSVDLRYGQAMRNFYYPLYWLDDSYWHVGMHPATYERNYEALGQPTP